MSGRIRSIKPELLEDEKAAALSDAAWRLFVSSWLLADDHGRFRAGGRYLAAQVWQDTSRVKDAERARHELAQAGRIRVYVIDGDTYAEIPTWGRHQRVDNAGKPRVPPPGPNDYENLDAVSRRVAEARGESPPEPPRSAARRGEEKERTSDQGEGGGPADAAPAASPPLPPVVPLDGPPPTEDALTALNRLADEGHPWCQKIRTDVLADGGRLSGGLRRKVLQIAAEQREEAIAANGKAMNGHAVRDGPKYVDARTIDHGPRPGEVLMPDDEAIAFLEAAKERRSL